MAVIENSALVALRTTFGGYTLQQALEHRSEISQQVCCLMTPHMDKIGVKVEEAQVLRASFRHTRFASDLTPPAQITDIIIPQHIAESLAAQAVAQRSAQAKIILAKVAPPPPSTTGHS